MTLKTTLVALAAALVGASLWLLAGHAGDREPKSQIDQIEIGRS